MRSAVRQLQVQEKLRFPSWGHSPESSVKTPTRTPQVFLQLTTLKLVQVSQEIIGSSNQNNRLEHSRGFEQPTKALSVTLR